MLQGRELAYHPPKSFVSLSDISLQRDGTQGMSRGDIFKIVTAYPNTNIVVDSNGPAVSAIYFDIQHDYFRLFTIQSLSLRLTTT